MADNQIVSSAAFDVATDKVTYSGDADQNVQLFRPVHITGAEGSKTVIDLSNAGGLIIGGNVAHDDVDSGNPVKIGGYASSAMPTSVAAGDRVNSWYGLRGQQMVSLFSSDSTALADATSNDIRNWISANTSDWPKIGGFLFGFNGTTWDRVRTGNTGRLQVDVVTSPSAATAGNVAHDAVDSGNPVKIGGYASAVAVNAVADGDRVNAWFGSSGQLVVTALATNTSAGSDGTAMRGWTVQNTNTGQYNPASIALHGYNGTTWDRIRVANTGRLQVDVVSSPSPGTGTLANVSASVTSVTLIALNAARRGATIWNDSTDILYVKFGSAATATSCTVKLVGDAFYEVPFGYTGIITGIWASATGAARVTELS